MEYPAKTLSELMVNLTQKCFWYPWYVILTQFILEYDFM